MKRAVSLLATLLLLVLPLYAGAQVPFPGPAGIAGGSSLSAIVTNTSATNVLYQQLIPAGFAAGPLALHIQAFGVLTTTAAPGAYTARCGWGYTAGTPQTLTIANGLPLSPSLTNAPIRIDCWVTGQGATGATANTNYMWGSVQVPNSGVGQSNAVAAFAQTGPVAGGGIDNTNAQILAMDWSFQTAQASQGITISHVNVMIGN